MESNQAGQRLDKFLHKYLPQAGGGFLYKMLRKKNITLNGKKAEGKELLSVGDRISIFFSEETLDKFSGPAPSGRTERVAFTQYRNACHNLHDIQILYEDDNIVIVNKPVGLLTQKAAPGDLTLNEWLIGYLLESNVITETELRTFHPSVCNRLDRNTSGIVLCGKSLAGSQALSRVIKERTLQKFYRTVCCGELKETAVLEGYLGKDARTNKVTVLPNPPRDAADGVSYQPIRTAYRPIAVKAGFTLLEVDLMTGKTHQIRSHLASIGHPIIGDAKYGSKKDNEAFQKEFSLRSQLLHAYRVVFPREEGVLSHLNGQEIIAPCPALFGKIEGKLFG